MPSQPEDDFASDHATARATRFDTSEPYRAYRIRVDSGPDKGLTLVLDGTEPSRVLIGKSEVCHVRLSDRAVSRRHVALLVEPRGLRVMDIGSTNGTRLNGLHVIDAYARAGSIIELGGTSISVHESEGESDPVLSADESFGDVVGASLQMRRLYPLCERLAQADVPVIIEGETGTGKEAMAESLHLRGPRAGHEFVVFDCTAVPPTLVEAELFGHERGAFTGATAARRGVFRQAQGGTLLIDEIGDLDLSLQPKLLRAIDRGEVRPVGSDRSVKVDVRLIAATRRDLDREVQAGRFRDDLFHRLAVGRIELPPLRTRRGDVRKLARHFWTQLGGPEEGPSEALLSRWADHDWPGNVRELRNTISRHLVLGELADLSPSATISEGEGGATDSVVSQEILSLPLKEARQRAMEELEHRYVLALLQRHHGNVTHAARAAGVARRYLQTIKARIKE